MAITQSSGGIFAFRIAKSGGGDLVYGEGDGVHLTNARLAVTTSLSKAIYAFACASGAECLTFNYYCAASCVQ